MSLKHEKKRAVGWKRAREKVFGEERSTTAKTGGCLQRMTREGSTHTTNNNTIQHIWIFQVTCWPTVGVSIDSLAPVFLEQLKNLPRRPDEQTLANWHRPFYRRHYGNMTRRRIAFGIDLYRHSKRSLLLIEWKERYGNYWAVSLRRHGERTN